MTDRIGTMSASVTALMRLLEGADGWEGRTARILYNAFTGHDGPLIESCCQAVTANGYDGILAFFDPARPQAGPVRIGVIIMESAMIKVQMGRLWLAPHGDRAVLVPWGVGKRHGHYAVEDGRIVQRVGWPAETLERGIHRAEARLAEVAVGYLDVEPAL
ncbi:hypothetical protein HZF05_13745 [Sphingomonas sp. CGMCC 1.13654]|uniref:Uncharacterized protein n=1 Tax=Sphingomonas chungangi TaxID=2683589 RepID=A0A838LCD6_9SPHN|nr:hypothetical protein [Sphingomonas chungangi]MBA2935148.1 hypothetical protein [Sphingomonas chungangi]MVW57712.1 hypothetical protein [Sphingomonas chungangi]